MTKQKRPRRKPRQRKPRAKPATEAAPAPPPPAMSWADGEGLHALRSGERPTAEQLAEMTRVYQAKIRSHPLWAEVVQQLGEAEAERWLAQCQVELR